MDTPFYGKKVVITGGLGFIGSNLARRLLNLGAHVLLIDSLVPQYGGNLYNIEDIRDRVQVNISDVRDPYSFAVLIQDCDFLFNLAGQTSHMDSMTDPYTDLEINGRAQLSILEACRHHNPKVRVVFASTRQLYGKPEYLPVDEKHPVRPVDVNGINKMAGEGYHLLYHQVYDIQTCVLRLTNTYGPRMRIKDARQTFLGVWVQALVNGRPFEVWEGQQLRDFTYVDDAVEAFILAASHPEAVGKIYNLGGVEIISLIDLAKLLVQANDGNGEFLVKSFPADRKRIDIGDYYADDRLIRTALGWQPRVALLEGLRRTLDYYRTAQNHYLP
ncbi:MAG: NAD-dependent epimerase/dehydratase family protein [Anaerolineae bacterium]